MKFPRLTTRIAVGGVTAALATAGLVGATTTTASAAPVSTTYTCTSALGSFPVPVTVELSVPLTSAPAGFPVPTGLLSYKSTATIPGAAQAALDGAMVQSGKSDDFGADLR